MSEFSKNLSKIAVPVALQCMLQSSFSIVDQLMIGQLGESAISAVGLGGNFSLIYGVVSGAVASVAGILIAQFLGADDKKEAWASFQMNLLVSILIAVLFAMACQIGAGQILGLYTEDMSIVEVGTEYFKLVSVAYIPMAVSTILSTWLRCRDHATLPLVATFLSVVINTCMNYCLIFGRFGFDALGVKGAAVATLISSLCNLAFILVGFLLSLKKDGEKISFSLVMRKISLKEYIIMIAPILISEFLWSLGQNVESGVFGHLSTESLAAYTLTSPIQGLVCGALSGLSAAAGIMIGKRLGAKEYDEAYNESKKIMFAGVVGSAVFGLLLVALSGFYVSFYKVEETVRYMGKMLLIIFACYSPVKVSNMILGGGILKSGGDTKRVMVIDIVGTWLVGIPLCFFTAYVCKFQILGVYGIFTFEEVVRLVISLVVFKKKSWMNSLN